MMYVNAILMAGKAEGYIDVMMMPGKAGGYVDVMLMPGKVGGYINSMLIPEKAGGYIDSMLMPHKVGGYIIVILMPHKAGGCSINPEEVLVGAITTRESGRDRQGGHGDSKGNISKAQREGPWENYLSSFIETETENVTETVAETVAETVGAKDKGQSVVTPSPATTDSAPKVSPPQAAATSGPRKIIATPYAKKLAKQHKVDINKMIGTGPFERITPDVVEKASGITPNPSKSIPVANGVAAPTPVASKKASPTSFPEIPGSTAVPFTTMQAAVSKNMMESLSVPTFRVGYSVNTNALDALYDKVKPKGVTMTAPLAKAAAMALAQHPLVNATCKYGKSFTYNSSINIAVAVAINGGLITPVLQDADKLATPKFTFSKLSSFSSHGLELVDKSRAKQLQPHEYNSGNFKLSNLGMFSLDRFDAILPPGQGTIMAVGVSKPTVVADAEGFFCVKNKMLVCLVSGSSV
ncbi:hypothetical protein FXO38_12306 [Capsicum annuum]|nr:hypothetical protein FXO38_12306 [Capsicum annuum]